MSDELDLQEKAIRWLGRDEYDKFCSERADLKDVSLDEKVRLFLDTSVVTRTEFFRYPASFQYFRGYVVEETKNRRLRVASVGCSTGEEAYSILMSAWDVREQLTIEAFDSNPDNIEIGKNGRYPWNKYYCGEYTVRTSLKTMGFNNTTPIYSIDHLDGMVTFTQEARSRISFQQINILTSCPPYEYDVILLCNVLRHLAPEGVQRVLGNVSIKLKDESLLFLGSDASIGITNFPLLHSMGYRIVDLPDGTIFGDRIYRKSDSGFLHWHMMQQLARL